MSRLIEIIVSLSGAAQVQTKGFSGSSCREASRFLEQALGPATKELLTAEFHQTASQTSGQQSNHPST